MADNTNKTIHTLVDSDGKPIVLAVAVQPRANDNTSTLTDGAGSSLRCVRLNIVDAQSMTSIEEVDVYTTADAVYYNTATKETIIDYINFRLAYTNSVPLPENIGAFHKGDIFNEMDLKDVLEGILYPNITPTVELSCSLPSTPNFVGQDISPVEFTLTLSTEAKNLPEGNCGQLCISTLLFNQTTPADLPDSGVCFGPTVDKSECTEEDCPTPDTGAFANYAILGGVSLVALVAIIAVSRKKKFYRI